LVVQTGCACANNIYGRELAEEAALVCGGGLERRRVDDAAQGVHGGAGGWSRRPRREEERFVVPVGYLKHPLFVALLKAAEDEYGFEQKGAITIPCGVDHFRHVQGIIQHQKHHHHISSGFVSGDGGHHGHHNNHHHFHIAGCFRA